MDMVESEYFSTILFENVTKSFQENVEYFFSEKMKEVMSEENLDPESVYVNGKFITIMYRIIQQGIYSQNLTRFVFDKQLDQNLEIVIKLLFFGEKMEDVEEVTVADLVSYQ